MDHTYLEQRLEGFAEEAQHLVTWHQLCDDALSPALVKRYQGLSSAVRNTLRGLSQYDDACEIVPILEDMSRPFLPDEHGMAGILLHDVPGQMYVFELFGNKILHAAEAQMARLAQAHASPNIQLDLGLQALKEIAPNTANAKNSITEDMAALYTTLDSIAGRLGEMQFAGKNKPVALVKNAAIAPDTLLKVTNQIITSLVRRDELDYRAIIGLRSLLSDALTLKPKLDAEAELSSESAMHLLGLLHGISNELPRSHANRALQRDVSGLIHAQAPSQNGL